MAALGSPSARQEDQEVVLGRGEEMLAPGSGQLDVGDRAVHDPLDELPRDTRVVLAKREVDAVDGRAPMCSSACSTSPAR